MQNITAIKHEEAEGKAKELLDGVKAKLGFVPNMMATMAASPAVLKAYLNMSGTLGKALNSKLNEKIALTVAEINGCQYVRRHIRRSANRSGSTTTRSAVPVAHRPTTLKLMRV